MSLGKRQRKIILALGFTLGGLVLLFVSLPLWLPWILKPVAGHYGAHFAQYQRVGYNRFSVSDLTFTNEDIHLRAQKLEAVIPSLWVLNLKSTNTARPFATIDGWTLESVSNPARTSTTPVSVFEIVQDVTEALEVVQRWVGSATLSNGTVRVDKTVVKIPSAVWSRDKLRAFAALGDSPVRAEVDADLGHKPVYWVRLDSKLLGIQSSISISNEADSIFVAATNTWNSNQVLLEARFGREGVLPETGRLQSARFAVPGQLAGISNYGEVAGSFSATWERGNIALDLDADATPQQTETNYPPVKMTLHARGNTNSLVIEKGSLIAPWLRAELSNEVRLSFKGPLVSEPAALEITADLSRQPWFSSQGTVKGRADILPGTNGFPIIQFDLEAADVGEKQWLIKTAMLKGHIEWPSLTLSNASARLEDGSALEAKGRVNLERQEIEEGHVHFTGSILQQWIPAGWSCDGVAMDAHGHGPFTNVIHEGQVIFTNLSVQQFQPVQLEVQWNGEQLAFKNAKIELTNGVIALSSQAAVVIGDSGIEIQLGALGLRKGATKEFDLKGPANIHIALANGDKPLAVEVGGFHWAGEAGDIELHGDLKWPSQASLEATVHEVRSDVLQDFVKSTVEQFQIHEMHAEAAWTNGPAIFQLQLSAEGTGQTNFPLTGQVNLRGDAAGVAVSNLVVLSGSNAVAEAHGSLPVLFTPGSGSNIVSLNNGSRLQFSVTTKPDAVLWDKLAALTGISLVEPDCRINLAGTWAAPEGHLRLGARQVQIRDATAQMPKFENLSVDVLLDRDRAEMTNATVEVQGQPVIVTAKMPLGQSFWNGLRQKQIPNWDQATARVQIEQAEVAAFSLLLPRVLGPQGTLSADISLQPGGNLSGGIELQKGRTRPLGNLGAVRDINAKMKFAGRKMEFESVTANIGGSLLNVTGQVDLRGTNWLRGEIPPFALKVRGTNVPLSRQPDAVIRSDLDLAITQTNGAQALISGTAELRNSFFLRDLHDLIPGSLSAPSKRPPYFSIDVEPLAGWRLAARVTGTRFVRIRSTLFNGEVSANLRLEGTLKEPVALGDIRIDTGLIRFPFASLDVRQGFVTLSSEDPYRPKITVSAGSKQLGYDVKMDASGYVDAPILQFSSIPPLSSEQLVLMMTAGEMPRGTISLTPAQKAQTVAVFFGRDVLARLGVGGEGEDRLSFQSGQEVSEQGKPTYNIEYKLTKRWSLVGEYDRFNAFNAGLKWRVYSK